jgi:protein-L-isoaspartate(D-aspartate) O-methyltransferase
MPSRLELADIAAATGVRNPRVLDAMRIVPRGGFVPAELVSLAGNDEPIPIAHHQVTSQPSLIAAMIEAIDPHDDEIVLEVGTGLGYQTALLAKLARFVWSVEWWPDLAAAARNNLGAAGIVNAEVVTGDGTQGLPEHAPFHGIVVAAAFPDVPPPLVGQLAPGGRLVQPIGPGGDESVVLFDKRDDSLFRVRMVTLAHFVRLVGAHGYPIAEPRRSP